MRAPREIRERWRTAKGLRRAKRRIRRALWTRDYGYGMGQKFYGPDVESIYRRASEVMGILEAQARILEGRCD